jgi:hypothetical protein
MASRDQAGGFYSRPDLLLGLIAEADEGQAYFFAAFAEEAERVLGGGRAGLEEKRDVQCHETIMQIQRIERAALGPGVLKLSA